MSDLVERLRRAFDADSVAEKNLAIRAAYDFIAAMQTDAAPALKPAVEVWREAYQAYTQHTPWKRGRAYDAAAAVIEADRAATIAANDAEIAVLQAHADALAKYAVHQPDCRIGKPDCLGEEELCTCGLSNALRAYEEFRR